MISPAFNIGFLVHDIARLSRREFNRRAISLELSQAQWRALSRLALREGINQARLAECLEIQPMTLVRHIDRLEAAGLVARKVDPKDRRAVLLYLTPKAQPVLDRMYEIGEGLWGEATAHLSEAERAAMIDCMSRIKRNLQEADCGCDHSQKEPDRE